MVNNNDTDAHGGRGRLAKEAGESCAGKRRRASSIGAWRDTGMEAVRAGERVERAESRIENQPTTQEGSARPTADTSGWRT